MIQLVILILLIYIVTNHCTLRYAKYCVENEGLVALILLIYVALCQTRASILANHSIERSIQYSIEHSVTACSIGVLLPRW